MQLIFNRGQLQYLHVKITPSSVCKKPIELGASFCVSFVCNFFVPYGAQISGFISSQLTKSPRTKSFRQSDWSWVWKTYSANRGWPQLTADPCWKVCIQMNGHVWHHLQTRVYAHYRSCTHFHTCYYKLASGIWWLTADHWLADGLSVQ